MRSSSAMSYLALVALVGCGRTPPPWDPSDPPHANVLVIVIDDVGTDKIGAWGSAGAPRTPNIDALAADGVRFRAAISYPTCSPSRAAMLTGQHPRRWGVVEWIRPWSDHWSLPVQAFTVPDLLAAAADPWHLAYVGKWHLVDFDDPLAATHPVRHGWHTFAGSLANLGNSVARPAEGTGYHRWEKSEHGALRLTERYPTTDTVDDGIAAMAAAPAPWLVWVSLNAAHEPFHWPPAELLAPGAEDLSPYDAAVEAMDAELGRLIDAAPPGTAIVLLSDNGTPWGEQGKGTLFEGGVRVPLIVAGPWVTRPGTSDALVHVVDVFATIGDNAGVDPGVLPAPIAGRSWLPLLADPGLPGHDIVFAASEQPNGPGPWQGCRMARSAMAKFVRCDIGGDHLYAVGRDGDGPDLATDPPPELAAERSRLERALVRWQRENTPLVPPTGFDRAAQEQ